MKDKITYILGAGASYGAFPLVKKSPEWNNKGLAEILAIEGTELIRKFSDQPSKYEAQYIGTAMKETGTNAIEFGNIDSYAKYLFHTGKFDQYDQLKEALTYYFVRQQICKEFEHLKEKRYLNFITSLVNKESKFPEHVKILSWNYDFLFELAALRWGIEVVNETGNDINRASAPFIEYFPPLGIEENGSVNYSLVHLNGVAGHYPNKNKELKKYSFNNIIISLLGGKWNRKITEVGLLSQLERRIKEQNHLFTFAWDNQSDSIRYLGNPLGVAKTIIKDTTILVVIGYSFPFYNREYDNEIFEVLKPTLKKIYFQDPKINGEFLNKRYGLQKLGMKAIKTSLDIDVEHITDTDQFHIPVEV